VLEVYIARFIFDFLGIRERISIHLLHSFAGMLREPTSLQWFSTGPQAGMKGRHAAVLRTEDPVRLYQHRDAGCSFQWSRGNYVRPRLKRETLFWRFNLTTINVGCEPTLTFFEDFRGI
jgi:hypothetical protein